MSILQSIWSLWWKKEAPKVKWFTMWLWLSINYDTSLDIFFKYYKYNPYVRAAINRRKKDVYRFWYEIKKGTTLLDESILEDLLQDSIWYTPKKFFERVVRDYEITWNAYIYISRETWKNVFIQVLDPRYVKPVVNRGWQVLWYVQNLEWIRVFLKDEILHLRDDNDIENESIGSSKMESLFIDLETDKEAKESNLAFFKNNQTPASLVLMDPEYELEDEAKMKKVLKDIFESGKFAWGTNRHRSAMLEWVKEIVKVQDKISDAEFLEQRKFSLALVCSIYTVNQDLLWFTENSNRSTWDVQLEIYYDSIEEEETMLDEFFTKMLQTVYWDESIILTAIKDSLRTLKSKSDIATNLYEKWVLSREESREIVWYAPKAKTGDTFSEKKETDDSKTKKDKEESKK